MSFEIIRKVLQNPTYTSGSNDMGTIDIYNQRKKFNNKNKYKENSLNLQTQSTLYGRLDLQQNVIVPNSEILVNLFANGQQQNHLVFPFVNDAYREMEQKITQLISYGKIVPNEIIPFKTQNTYFDIENKYKQNLKDILDLFFNYIYKNGTINKISNFKDFINYFIDFTTLSNISLSLTKFNTNFGNLSSTGLSVELLNQQKDLDIIKEIFYDNRNYNSYNSFLIKYGFSIDVNCPWTIVFNINSKIAQQYLAKYNIQNLDDLFENYYKRTYETELSKMIEILMNFYNDKICDIKPYLYETKTTNIKGGIKTFSKTSERIKVTEEILYKLIPEVSLLKFYFYIRLREQSFDLGQEEFDSLMNKLTILHHSEGVNAVNNFVNNYTKFMVNDGSNPRLSLTRETVTSYNNLNVHFRI